MRVSSQPDRPALLDFDFVDAASPWRSGCRWLAGASREAWVPAVEPESGDDPARIRGAVLQRRAGGFAVLGLECWPKQGQDLAASTEALYRQLLGSARPSPHPFLIRIWNFFAAINEGEGDAERYRRFCVGRDAAADERFRNPPPAATAIGTSAADAPLTVVALCSSTPALALENPRQTPAWQYPRAYGPVPPGFSRGAVLRDEEGALLLASGTASIVGHESLHPGDVKAQLEESLVNLGVLLDEGWRRSGERFGLAGMQALRVYLRHPADLPVVQARLATLDWPLARVAFLQGDICRSELDIELEGVFAPGLRGAGRD